MGLIRSITGMVAVEMDSADIPALLSAIAELGIPVFHAEIKGELTLQLRIRREDWRGVRTLCRRRGERVRIRNRLGLYWELKGLLHRPVLLAGFAALVLLVLLLPRCVLFVRVEGNHRIPDARILEAAADSGIRFGATRREVRSERMKNALLDAVPQLQWAGVNTYGCLAVISVRERPAQEQELLESGGIGSIVAACDGLVLSATASRGTCLCRPGQAVARGEVLISGYTDLGLAIGATRAEGEIFAQTRRLLRAVTPLEARLRGDQQEKVVKFSLLIGKTRINFWKGSGICGGSCGRMYEEYYITLPGGFRLPIALIKETVTVSEIRTVPLDPTALQVSMERFGKDYMCRQMICGSIQGESMEYLEENGILMLKGEYLCTEMIGRFRQEKIGE